MPIGDKTKKRHGVDLHSRCFAFVGSEDDTSSWHLCVHVLGDPAKTTNAVKNALGRFDETRGIPDSERQRAYDTVYGAALALGIPAERRTFAANIEALPAAEPTPPVPVRVKRKPVEVTDPEIAEAVAMADKRATAILRALGLE